MAPLSRIEPIPLGTGRILVGTCGYSYKDWIGTFYPSGIKHAEMLEFYARHFSTVEIDATYYRIPPPATFGSMAARTPDEFQFTVKLPGSLTHLPAGETLGVWDDARYFRESVEPLVEAGKFAAALAQFPFAFKPGAKTEGYLRALRDALAGLPLVAEFRNREWQKPATFELLAGLDIGWCNVDEPQFEGLMRPSNDATGAIGYVRFHGRNAAQWWRGSVNERYDYDYSTEELAPWTGRVAELAGETAITFALFNNHRLGKAAKNAATFAGMLLDRLRADYKPLGET